MDIQTQEQTDTYSLTLFLPLPLSPSLCLPFFFLSSFLSFLISLSPLHSSRFSFKQVHVEAVANGTKPRFISGNCSNQLEGPTPGVLSSNPLPWRGKERLYSGYVWRRRSINPDRLKRSSFDSRAHYMIDYRLIWMAAE